MTAPAPTRTVFVAEHVDMALRAADGRLGLAKKQFANVDAHGRPIRPAPPLFLARSTAFHGRTKLEAFLAVYGAAGDVDAALAKKLGNPLHALAPEQTAAIKAKIDELKAVEDECTRIMNLPTSERLALEAAKKGPTP